jgi:hypothetical protein
MQRLPEVAGPRMLCTPEVAYDSFTQLAFSLHSKAQVSYLSYCYLMYLSYCLLFNQSVTKASIAALEAWLNNLLTELSTESVEK